jgi:hypothetical protein
MSEIERSRESAYEQVYEYVKQETVANPDFAYAVAEETLKTTLCANGSLKVDQVETALQALGEQDRIQYGSGWIVPIVDKQFHRDAIGWLANREQPPKSLIGKMNKAVQAHEW